MNIKKNGFMISFRSRDETLRTKIKKIVLNNPDQYKSSEDFINQAINNQIKRTKNHDNKTVWKF